MGSGKRFVSRSRLRRTLLNGPFCQGVCGSQTCVTGWQKLLDTTPKSDLGIRPYVDALYHPPDWMLHHRMTSLCAIARTPSLIWQSWAALDQRDKISAAAKWPMPKTISVARDLSIIGETAPKSEISVSRILSTKALQSSPGGGSSTAPVAASVSDTMMMKHTMLNWWLSHPRSQGEDCRITGAEMDRR